MALLLMILAMLGLGSVGPDAEPGDRESTAAARAGVKQLVNAVESCAANRIDGAYFGATADQPDAPECLDPETLCEYERGLCTLELGPTPPEPGAFQVAPIGRSGQAYFVQAAITIDGGIGYFAELHTADGLIHKLCGDEPFGPAALPDGTERLADCDRGTWE